eukprot:6191207-Pleurochrysis_carterae.AAC.1
MKEPRCAGVLIGYHEHGLGPLLLHVAHHAGGEDVGDDDVEGDARRVTRAHNAGPVERKALHTFRCGDVVFCTAPEGNSSIATVFGISIANIGTQMRRLLVLCEGNCSSKEQRFGFFVAAVTSWARTPADGVAMDKFDPDDDDQVKVAPEAQVKSMLQ